MQGDTFLTADPYPHMLSLSDDSWDLQFTEDIGYVVRPRSLPLSRVPRPLQLSLLTPCARSQVNFGWIFARPSTATVAFWQRAFDAYLKKNEWDVRPLSSASFVVLRAQAEAASPPYSNFCSLGSCERVRASPGARPATSTGGSSTTSTCASRCFRCPRCARRAPFCFSIVY